MRFGLREVGILVSVGALIFCCSCEKHHLGELPPVQREHAELAKGEVLDPDMVTERPAHAAASENPTPVEFFPAPTPR